MIVHTKNSLLVVPSSNKILFTLPTKVCVNLLILVILKIPVVKLLHMYFVGRTNYVINVRLSEGVLCNFVKLFLNNSFYVKLNKNEGYILHCRWFIDFYVSTNSLITEYVNYSIINYVFFPRMFLKLPYSFQSTIIESPFFTL